MTLPPLPPQREIFGKLCCRRCGAYDTRSETCADCDYLQELICARPEAARRLLAEIDAKCGIEGTAPQQPIHPTASWCNYLAEPKTGWCNKCERVHDGSPSQALISTRPSP